MNEMYQVSESASFQPTTYRIWLVGVSFVLFQFFLQLSSGVVIGGIMEEMSFSALVAGILGSSFYYVYTIMQIPVGILFDRQNSVLLLTGSALVCSFGCFYFAQSYTFHNLVIGRLLIGAGSSFAFVGLSHLLRQHYPIKSFGFMIGLSETLGFFVTVLGMICLGRLIDGLGWRSFINFAGLAGIFIAFCCWLIVPPSKTTSPTGNTKSQLLLIFRSSKTWINGLYVGLSFSIITVFGAMWAIPFLQVKLNCSLSQASYIDSMIFLGAAISCPLFGWLATYFDKRRPLMIFSCLFTAFLLLVILFAPNISPAMMGLLLFLSGISCGAYMLSFTIANELAPEEALSTCTGFTNTLAMVTAPVLQPLVGYLLDTFKSQSANDQLANYQWALIIIPLSLVVASVLVLFLPEKKVKRIK